MVKVDVIDERMKELNIASDERLAELAEVSRQTIWNLRNSKHVPETKTIMAVAKALRLPWTAIVEEVAA